MKKVYLETPKAVVKALKEGKVIKDDNGYSYKLVDGFIVSADVNEFFVGDNISSGYKPYILEEEPLKIEVGKWYETRDGRKAFVYAKIGIDCPYPFCVVKAGKLDAYNVNEEGKQAADEQPLDLISPWKEDK